MRDRFPWMGLLRRSAIWGCGQGLQEKDDGLHKKHRRRYIIELMGFTGAQWVWFKMILQRESNWFGFFFVVRGFLAIQRQFVQQLIQQSIDRNRRLAKLLRGVRLHAHSRWRFFRNVPNEWKWTSMEYPWICTDSQFGDFLAVMMQYIVFVCHLVLRFPSENLLPNRLRPAWIQQRKCVLSGLYWHPAVFLVAMHVGLFFFL